MILSWKILILLPMITTGSIIEKDRFDNYRVYSVQIDTLDQLQLFQNLEENSSGFLLWNYPVFHDTVDIMVAPHKLSEFNDMVELYNLKFNLKIKNLQRFQSSTISFK